jgi:predicted histone-like DNA-binding protein
MALKYSIQQKSQAGVKGGGQRKFYAAIVNDGDVTIDDMVSDIEKISALSEPDIRRIVSALQEVIQTKLSESLVVHLEQLGTFYPAISSEGKEKEEEVNEHCIKKVGINYRPTQQILQALENVGRQKVIPTKKKYKR